MELGELPDAAMSWFSDLDGLLGSGTVLNLIGLSTGTHVITFSASDGVNAPVTDSITVSVH